MGLLRRYSRLTLPFFVIGFFTFLVFSLFSGLKKNRFVGPSYTGDSGTEKAAVKIKRLSFVQTETGVLSWMLDAAGAVLPGKEQEAFLEDVAVAIPYGDGAMLELEGDEGVVDSDKKEFSLWKKQGLMTVELENGYTLRTSGLKWHDAQREIVSLGPAFISGSQIRIDGSSLRISIDHQEMTLIGDVKVSIH